MSRPPKELVRAIVASLEKGDGWEFSGFEAVHARSGVTLWLANDAYGLSIHVATSRCVEKFGGVVGWAMPFGWRRRVYKAACKAGWRYHGSGNKYSRARASKRAVAALYDETR